ncbi:carboxymuconolactone decarboxylase family protein [Streptomyces sp. NPDC049813]|uniref:carboxymuconolactone decarboxylase family protein n=1 Tax=Streptomyces sp. NPDC049813 TaxID=3365597 RepID=UPI0037ADFC8D
MSAAPGSESRQERFDRGMETLSRVDGDGGRRVVEALADVSPELAHQIVAWGFGEIYRRPALPPRDRQLVTLGMLTALGGCEPQLEVHVRTSLKVGLTPQEIVETFLHAAGYCGFPKALNATFVAKKVFGELGLLPVAQE